VAEVGDVERLTDPPRCVVCLVYVRADVAVSELEEWNVGGCTVLRCVDRARCRSRCDLWDSLAKVTRAVAA
jgi:hypothetical protein